MLSIIAHYAAISLRTACAFLFVVLVVSKLGKATVSSLSPSELVMCMLIGSSVQNAMVGGDTTLAGGIVASGTLIGVDFLLRKWRFLHPSGEHARHVAPVVLVNDGQVLQANLDRQLITSAELTAALREHGVSRIEDVDLAVLEVDGAISVLRREFTTPETLREQHPAAPSTSLPRVLRRGYARARRIGASRHGRHAD